MEKRIMPSPDNPKVRALYKAVGKLVRENADLSRLKVSDITKEAGIGKGTAYDYFGSREEIIVGAILYFEQTVMETVRGGLRDHRGFLEGISYLLEAIERGSFERECVFRYLHLLSGTDALGHMLRERIDGYPENQPTAVIYELVEEGVKEKILDGSLPRSYMVAAVSTKLFAWLMYVDSQYKNADCDNERFRELLVEGILKELGAAGAERSLKV